MAILAYDIGGSSIKYGVVSETGELSGQGKVKTPATLEEFYVAVDQIRRDCSTEVRGAGFSFPGAVDFAADIIRGDSAVPYIHNFPIGKALSERLGLPVSMENDANCAGLGECTWGAGREFENAVFMVIGSGIGGAVIMNHQIYRGNHFHGGELGYMVLSSDGEILSNTGSTRALVERVATAKGVPVAKLDGEKVFAMADGGDAIAQREIEAMCHAIALAAYNLQYSLDPDIILLGGGVSARADLVEKIQQHVDDILQQVKIAQVRPLLKACEAGNAANLLGAAAFFQQVHAE
jgi:predicted NBD/HSP70 family sugar kinase